MSQRDESPLRQLSVRGFGRELERTIRRRARVDGVSLNEAVLRVLREGAGLVPPAGTRDAVGSSLDHLAGTWTDTDQREFDDAIEPLEQIDHDLWAPRAEAGRRTRRR